MQVELRDPNGVVGIVELVDGVATADAGAAKLLDHMVIVQPGHPKRRLLPSDGIEYLEALAYNLRGTHLWATSPIHRSNRSDV